jgi:hypothetical protein
MHRTSNNTDRATTIESDKHRAIPNLLVWSLALLGIALWLAGGYLTLIATP